MTILKPLGFTVAALVSAFVALLAFAVSQASAATTPSDAFAWPAAGSGGTAATILTIVSLAIVALGASVYGYVALKRAYAAEAPRRLYVRAGREPERGRRPAQGGVGGEAQTAKRRAAPPGPPRAAGPAAGAAVGVASSARPGRHAFA